MKASELLNRALKAIDQDLGHIEIMAEADKLERGAAFDLANYTKALVMAARQEESAFDEKTKSAAKMSTEELERHLAALTAKRDRT